MRTTFHTALRGRVHRQEGHAPTPSAGMVDSHAVKAKHCSGVVGDDGGKQGKDRQCNLGVDTLGLMLAVMVFAAGGSRFPYLCLLWAASGNAGTLAGWGRKPLG